MIRFSSMDRDSMEQRLKQEPLDLLIIGGGITGAGIALDGVSRGLKTGVVEMQDFAAGTSSRSTKLVHGGLRYLKQFELKLVAEVGKERAIVYENGPHVTTPEWMMLPFYKGGNFGPFMTNLGLRVYDFLANVRKEDRRKMLRAQEALEVEPLLKKEGLQGAGYYVEYKTDDARLTIEVIKQAVQNGAYALNYTKVIDFVYAHEKVIGVLVENEITGETYQITAKKIINASGPWVDKVRELENVTQEKELILTKGVHIVFSKKDFPLQQAIYFDAPDGRMIFAIPRDGTAYVGTTDTSYDGDITSPQATETDVTYLLEAVHFMFPTLAVTSKQIVSSWAGLRPLIAEKGKNPNEISRKDEIFISTTGLITIAGGKLTGYRKMAENVVDTVVKQLKEETGVYYPPSRTKHMTISGGDVGGEKGFKNYMLRKLQETRQLGIHDELGTKLIQRYGSNVEHVLSIYSQHEAVAREEGMDAIILAQLIYAIKYESTYTPADFFVRRTGAIYFEYGAVLHHKESVIRYMSKVLKWDAEQEKKYRTELEQLLTDAASSFK